MERIERLKEKMMEEGSFDDLERLESKLNDEMVEILL